MRKRTIIQFSIDGILALIGLGDLFVPEIKSWVFAGVIWGIAVMWAIFILVLWINDRKIQKQTESIKLNENVKSEANLKIGAKVDKIITLSYSTAMSGSEGNFIYISEGDKIIHVDVILSPSKPMTLAILSLDIWGKRFDALNMPTNILKTSDNYNLGFNIPKSLASTTKEARIYALANNSEWFSEPFLIDFGVSK